jgi:hypothetical protein
MKITGFASKSHVSVVPVLLLSFVKGTGSNTQQFFVFEYSEVWVGRAWLGNTFMDRRVHLDEWEGARQRRRTQPRRPNSRFFSGHWTA